MPVSPHTSRRTLVASTVAGVLAGSVWGAAIQALATPSTPSLSVIGNGDSQIVLLDTTRIRALILLGTPDEDLRLQIPALLTMLHQRIDFLVGTSVAIEGLGADFRKRWRVTHSFIFPTGTTRFPDTPEQTTVTQNLSVAIAGGTTITLTTSIRNAWNTSEASRYLWLVTIQAGESRIALAPDSPSARIMAPSFSSLVVVPYATVEQLSTRLSPASIATNSRDDLPAMSDEGVSGLLVRTYPQDIARFELREDGIALPTWAEGSIE